MIKPCKVIGLEMLKGNEEKISFYFTELDSYADITISRRWHKKLFSEMLERMKDGLTFDFMDINLEKDALHEDQLNVKEVSE